MRHFLFGAVATAVGIAIAQPARGEYFSGNALEEYGRVYDRVKVREVTSAADNLKLGIWYGYVAGAADAVNGTSYCPPERVTLGQVSDIIRRYMAAMPEHMHHTADVVVAAALGNAYPCPRQNRGSGT